MENKIAKILIEKNLTLSTVESCTGGLLSSKFTDVSGSSAFITLNLVTYANEAKHNILGVSWDTLNNNGAVSPECSFEMAIGLYNLTKSDICISTTGIAGPTGGSKEKPVGLMYSTIYTPNKYETFKIQYPSNIERIQMKQKFVTTVLENIYTFISFV